MCMNVYCSNDDQMNQIIQLLEEPRHFRRNVVIVVGIALLVRFALAAAFWHSWVWHYNIIEDDWNKLAINIVDHGTFGFSPGQSTVARGPIFPLIEIPLYLVFGQNYAGWCISLLLLDTFTCYLIIILFRKPWGNLPALLAGLYNAVNLPIIYYTAKIEQLTSMLPLLVLFVYLFSSWENTYSSRWRPWILGLVSGVMILNKTVYLPMPIACSALLIWSKWRDVKHIPKLGPIVLYLLVTAAVVAPWTVRNYIVTGGRLVPVQNMFWELFVQDVLYYDLDKNVGLDRTDGATLQYFIQQERQMLIANGVSPDFPEGTSRAAWEMARERAFRTVCLGWIEHDPGKILRVKMHNLWNFWVRAEDWHKTRLLILMQGPFLGAVIVSLAILLYKRRLLQVKYGLIIISALWAEHIPVFAWGRFSLDLVPILGLICGLGVKAWSVQSNERELATVCANPSLFAAGPRNTA
jgi:4-amino-4-deoxy-L-arabinose transferase-like glycosyltransferase